MIRAGAFSGFLSVALGAFGAHGLKAYLLLPTVYQTAAQYQMFHSLALVLVGILFEKNASKYLRFAGYAFLAGIILFSGSLYVLSLTEIRFFAFVTPWGGLSFLVGWVFLFVGARR